MSSDPDPPPAERSETPTERSDRNWNELMQELRVTQTGIQILTAFLLTLPFQPRFADLTLTQQVIYLTLAGGAGQHSPPVVPAPSQTTVGANRQ